MEVNDGFHQARLPLGVIPAKAGIQLSAGAGLELGPSFRWDDSW